LGIGLQIAVLLKTGGTSNRTQLKKNKSALKKALIAAVSKPSSYELIVGRANTAEAIRKRLDFVEKVFSGVL